MKITSISHHHSKKSIKAIDTRVGKGYVKRHHGSMPDVDVDFASDRRQEVKEYLENRYNKDGIQRVFSAGTFITEKIKSVIKDVARVHKLPVSKVNYINTMLDDNLTWTDLMRASVTNKRLMDFIQENYEVIEEILPLMGQPRSSGVHASAVIITPEIVNGKRVGCFDLLPIKRVDGLLVSELSGTDIDAIGILKNDVLGIAELSRLSEMLEIILKETGKKITMLQIVTEKTDDKEVFDILQRGLTQGVFQMSGDGITRFIKQMQPDCINDLIALVALFRPGTLDSGAAQNYVDCKSGLIEPEYLWGTYDILKDTYASIIYQEQVTMIAQKIGNLSLGDGVNLVKALSKKKLEKVLKFKERYFEGAKENGCPKEAAVAVWDAVEKAASYLFNKSHATAYGLTAYVGAWLKTHYPIVFYTVYLKWVDNDKLPALMNEMREVGGAEVVMPDINISDIHFVTDYKEKKIYWSLSRIKWLGAKAATYIVADRSMYGAYNSMEEFINRIFKYKLKQYQYWDDDDKPEELSRCPVNARCVKQLILAGAFDKCERLTSITQRFDLLVRAASMLGFEITEENFPTEARSKEWYWSQHQIAVSGMGSIDYYKIFKGMVKPSSATSYKYTELKDLSDEDLVGTRVSICATISEVEEKSYTDRETGEKKLFGKIMLQQNTDMIQVNIWNDAWSDKKQFFVDKKGEIVAAVALVKHSDYDNGNILQIGKRQYVGNL